MYKILHTLIYTRLTATILVFLFVTFLSSRLDASNLLVDRYLHSYLSVDSVLYELTKQFDNSFYVNRDVNHKFSKRLYHKFADKYGAYSIEVEWLCNSLAEIYSLNLDTVISDSFRYNSYIISSKLTSQINNKSNKTYTYIPLNSPNDTSSSVIRMYHNILYQSIFLFGINETTAGIAKELSLLYLKNDEHTAAYYYANRAYDWYTINEDSCRFKNDIQATNKLITDCKTKAERTSVNLDNFLATNIVDYSTFSKNARQSYIHCFETDSVDFLATAIVMNEYGMDCYFDGNYSEALHYLILASKHFDRLNFYRNKVPQRIYSLETSNLLTIAEIYTHLYDFDSAISYYEDAIISPSNQSWTYSSTVYANICLYYLYSKNNKYITAIKYLNEAREVLNDEELRFDILPNLGIHYKTTTDNITALSLLVKIASIDRYFISGMYDKALQELEESLANLPSQYNGTSLHQEIYLYKARCLYAKGDYYGALRSLSSIKIVDAFDMDLSSIRQYIDYQLLTIECFYVLDKFDSVDSLCQNALNVIEDFFSKNILTMPGSHQFALWHSVDPFLTKINSILFKLTGLVPNSLNTLAHLSLLSKGILFYSDSYIKHCVATCPDKRVKELYDLICQTKINSNIDTSELLNLYEAEFFNNQYVKTILANWNRDNSYELSVYTSHLNNDEIFIDFVQDFRIKDNSQSNLFANYLHAILITNQGVLKEIPLCCEDEITYVISDRTFSSNYSQLIWNKLENELSSFNTIYFSPCGFLHSLPLEASTSSNASFQEKNIIRLSTIRELAKVHNNGYKVELFGNIKYSTSNSNGYDANRGGDIQSIIRYGLNDLQYSLLELNDISSTVNSSGIFQLRHNPFSGSLATEETFKGLNGTDVNILHISSHAVYIPTNMDNFISESLSLSNCFIALSDFNSGIKTFPNTHGNDGVLTAWEISSLYFPNLNFVSISTCQSGLGDINNEGVFGLQRGFKKAGAESMLISLWKVDDHATQLLMSEFYKQWMLYHKNKREALRLAQKYVYNYSNEEEGVEYDYTDPYFWSGFVLLDVK